MAKKSTSKASAPFTLTAMSVLALGQMLSQEGSLSYAPRWRLSGLGPSSPWMNAMLPALSSVPALFWRLPRGRSGLFASSW